MFGNMLRIIYTSNTKGEVNLFQIKAGKFALRRGRC